MSNFIATIRRMNQMMDKQFPRRTVKQLRAARDIYMQASIRAELDGFPHLVEPLEEVVNLFIELIEQRESG